MTKRPSPVDLMLDAVPMTALPPPDVVDDGVPYVTHHGTLTIGGRTLDVVQLNTGERLITRESLLRFLVFPVQ